MINTINNKTYSFIEKAKLIHENKYDYSLVIYKRCDIKVKIICPIHGIFEQIPHNHLNKKSCPYCAKTKKFVTNINKKRM